MLIPAPLKGKYYYDVTMSCCAHPQGTFFSRCCLAQVLIKHRWPIVTTDCPNGPHSASKAPRSYIANRTKFTGVAKQRHGRWEHRSRPRRPAKLPPHLRNRRPPGTPAARSQPHGDHASFLIYLTPALASSLPAETSRLPLAVPAQACGGSGSPHIFSFCTPESPRRSRDIQFLGWSGSQGYA